MMRPAPMLAVEFLRLVEGCRLDAYADAGGVLTAGFGHTGPEIAKGRRYSQEQADAWLSQDVQHAATRLSERVNAEVLVGLTDHQYSALLSFVFNLGAAPGWTIWRLLNEGALDQVPIQLLRFDKMRQPDGSLKSVPGLAHRRTAEVALWRTPDVAVAAAIAAQGGPVEKPSGETRRAETPPTPLPVAKGQLSSAGAALATAMAAAPVAVSHLQGGAQAISNALGPYADRSGVVQHAVAALACLCAALAVLSVGLQWLHHTRLKRV
ncbi:MAG: lysozyme [Proteobacteria bacterium]|nr:lysozyme [Pseudomonadota bacterium]